MRVVEDTERNSVMRLPAQVATTREMSVTAALTELSGFCMSDPGEFVMSEFLDDLSQVDDWRIA